MKQDIFNNIINNIILYNMVIFNKVMIIIALEKFHMIPGCRGADGISVNKCVFR